MNENVREYWEQEPCGTGKSVTSGFDAETQEWFEAVEEHRYKVEPFIHSVAQFTRHVGKKLLEVGVGAGTDHLQWARAGLDCYGVDLTQAAIDVTSKRLKLYGLASKLQRLDAETLPFEDNCFDLVYSWGVIHHSENPSAIIAEIHRVLKPGGTFIGMMYGRRSPIALKLWIKHALLKGRPWRSISNVLWNHAESLGTKAYTEKELKKLFEQYSSIETIPIITPYDQWPPLVCRFYPNAWGWFIALRCKK